MDAVADLEQGRTSFAGQAWLAAFESLAAAEGAAPLHAEDLERLARAAYMLGRDDHYVAVWTGHSFLFRGEDGPRRRMVRPRAAAPVDSTLGESSENTCYEVDAEQAFSRQPLVLRESAAIGA